MVLSLCSACDIMLHRPDKLWAALQAKVMEFGVFINIGAPNYGLLHRSQFKVRANDSVMSVLGSRMRVQVHAGMLLCAPCWHAAVCTVLRADGSCSGSSRCSTMSSWGLMRAFSAYTQRLASLVSIRVLTQTCASVIR